MVQVIGRVVRMPSLFERFPQYIPDQREFHDAQINENWAAYDSPEWDATRRYEVAQLFRLIQPRTVLDIGCGCGFHDAEMAKYPFVESVVGIDASQASIAKANEVYPHQKVQRSVASFRDLPKSEYDLVVSFQTFEHFDDPDFHLEKLLDLVGPSGQAAIITPNRERYDNWLRTRRGEQPALMSVMHFREYTTADLGAMATQHGWEPMASFGYGFEGPRVSRLPHGLRLRIGRAIPSIAHGFGLVLRKRK